MPIKYQNLNLNLNYKDCVSQINNSVNNSGLYASELDDIISGNSSMNSINLPDIQIPTGTPNSGETYDFLAAINPNIKDDNKTTLDKANDDIYELIIQQNTMYIFGSLACASLLIVSIVIGKR